jgi:hypothetical protein
VAERVIDFLEFVQVNQHNRKRSAGARSPLPFGTQSLPEEPARLNASQAIRDRLLLQLLEYEGIVQRRCQQVGQRVHD